MRMRNCIFDIKTSSLTCSNTDTITLSKWKKISPSHTLQRIQLPKILLLQITAGQKPSCNYFTWFLKAYHQEKEQEKVQRTDTSLSGILSHILSGTQPATKGEVR